MGFFDYGEGFWRGMIGVLAKVEGVVSETEAKKAGNARGMGGVGTAAAGTRGAAAGSVGVVGVMGFAGGFVLTAGCRWGILVPG